MSETSGKERRSEAEVRSPEPETQGASPERARDQSPIANGRTRLTPHAGPLTSSPADLAPAVVVTGWGAVSPAGWGTSALREALDRGQPVACRALTRPGWDRPLRVRAVPPAPQSEGLAHPRLRRAGAISQFAVAAAIEALGDQLALARAGTLRLGVITCVMTGGIQYSRRFYAEVLHDPTLASPLLFPETVFNSPASHLAAVLGTSAVNYTLVGDQGTFLQGLVLAADWLRAGQTDAVVVVSTEETDWLMADAFRLFSRGVVLAEGAGAVCLGMRSAERGMRSAEATLPSDSGAPASGAAASLPPQSSAAGASPAIVLEAVTSPQLFLPGQSRRRAAARMRAELPAGEPSELLCDGLTGVGPYDAAEASAWADWPGARLSVKRLLGESAAASAWQCVVAADALARRGHSAATVSVVGCNQQAIGARFGRAA
jgi:3-oxoacyl-(acyl-carrier-protein) synthase